MNNFSHLKREMKQAAARTMIQLNWHQFARFDARYSVFFVTLNWKKNCFIPQISSDYWGIVIVLQKEYLRNFSGELNEIQWVKIACTTAKWTLFFWNWEQTFLNRIN